MTANIETPQANPDGMPDPIALIDYVDMLTRLVETHEPSHDISFDHHVWECLGRQVDADTKELRDGNPNLDTLPLGAPYDKLADVFFDAKDAVAQLELATQHRKEAIWSLMHAIQHIEAIAIYHQIMISPIRMSAPLRPAPNRITTKQ